MARLTTRAHERTRRDHATETAEDYVEAASDLIEREGVCRVTDLAEVFGVSHVTVLRIIKRLESEGLVQTQPYKPIELTEAGAELARTCRARHELVYRFLIALGVDAATAGTDAEGIEHHVSPATLERFRAYLDADHRRAGSSTDLEGH